MRYLSMISSYIFFVIVLVACQPASLEPPLLEDTKPQTQNPGSIPETTPMEPLTPLLTPEDTIMTPLIPPDAAAQKMVDLAKRYLAQRLGISVEQITLLEAKSVVWRDASLGCPKPAIDYIRVETPGYNIALEVGGNTYSIHTDASNRVVMCNRP